MIGIYEKGPVLLLRKNNESALRAVLIVLYDKHNSKSIVRNCNALFIDSQVGSFEFVLQNSTQQPI